MRIDHGSRYSLQTSSILGVIDPKQLVNVREISIHGDTESSLHWRTLPAGLRSALYDLLGKPDLITLTLMDIRDIDVSFIGRSRRLKELTLYGIKHSLSSSPSISSDGPPATRLADEKCSLRSLSVGQCGDALQCLRATTVVPQPVALKVYSGRYDEKMDTVLQVFSRNVETYEIQCHGPSGFLTGPGMIGHLPLHSGVLDFARLPKLKTLRIRLQLNQLWYLLSGLTPSLGQQIARLRSTNCLEVIDIVLELDEILHYWMRSRLDETLHPLFDPAWTDLDNTLGDKDAFSKLKKLRIWLKIPTHVVHSKEELASRFSVFKETVMPNLTRRGILEVVH